MHTTVQGTQDVGSRSTRAPSRSSSSLIAPGDERAAAPPARAAFLRARWTRRARIARSSRSARPTGT